MSVLLFGEAELDRQIAKVVPQIPAEHDSAIMGGLDEAGVQAILILKRDTEHGTFKAAAIARHTWAGDNQVGGALLYSWSSQ